MLILAAMKREYFFRVGTQEVSLTLPLEFNFWDVIERRFDLTPEKIYRRARASGGALQTSSISVPGQSQPRRVVWVPLGQAARAGETFLSFDILTGDMLFVDRLTYNFVKPKVGQGFVFRTDNIRHPEMESPPGSGRQRKEYYIKRLVGTPGDVLEVKAPELWRNGAPITGSDAFGANNTGKGDYHGYRNGGYLSSGVQYRVPEHHYFAMGDNSGNSADSRVWGDIPEKDVVGKPLFIYYPFSRRWGLPN
jgi:signal peptidase I